MALSAPDARRPGHGRGRGVPWSALVWGEPAARPLLLIHGVTSSAATWWRVGPALAAAGYRVTAVDQAGTWADGSLARPSPVPRQRRGPRRLRPRRRSGSGWSPGHRTQLGSGQRGCLPGGGTAPGQVGPAGSAGAAPTSASRSRYPTRPSSRSRRWTRRSQRSAPRNQRGPTATSVPRRHPCWTSISMRPGPSCWRTATGTAGSPICAIRRPRASTHG